MNHELLTQQMDQWMVETRQILTELVESLPDTPVLGPEFNSAHFDKKWLIYHRLRSSLLKGEEGLKDALSKEAIDKMLLEDSNLKFDLKMVKPQVRRTVYQSRLLANEWSKDLPFDVSDVDFSSGEVFETSHGKTSLYQKLRNLEHWCLTADAEDLVFRVLYYNRGLKKVAMSHIRRQASRVFLRKCYKTVHNAHRTDLIGFEVFKICCRKFLFTYVHGSRVTTVPKNSTSRRTINVEPWLNLICQRIIGISIRRKLNSVGNDLEHGQSDHQFLISNPTLSTIDLRSASNSNSLETCRFMLSKNLFNRVSSVRSPYVLSSEDGNYHHLNMVSAMGCGFTFEIMTLILLSVARTMDKNARVYGDDIIISNRHASHFCECIVALGYQINESKTFIQSSFRESCGSFWHDQFGYVEAYEIPLPKTWMDTIAVANKLFLLSKECEIIARAHRKVLEAAPRCSLGPYLPSKKMDSLNSWVWVPQGELNGSSPFIDTNDISLWPVHTACKSTMRDWNYSSFDVWMGFTESPELASPYTPILKKGNIEKQMFYLNSGRRVKDTIRNSSVISTCLFARFDDNDSFFRVTDILSLTG